MTEEPWLSERVRAWRLWPAVALTTLFGLAIVGSWLSKAPPKAQEINASAPTTTKESVQDAAAETVAVYTEVLAWFTGVLAIVGGSQGYLLYRQIRLARDEFHATHRPRIRVRRIVFDGYGPNALGPAFISVVNVGEGRAQITGTAGGFYLRSSDGRWESGRPAFDKFGVPPEPVIAAGQLVSWMVSPTRNISVGEYGELATGGSRLWLVGEIRYRDDAGITRQTGFAWVCDRRTKEFSTQKDEESYNYED